jgi:enoyl-CoA hydratase/carnithine racemase
VLLTRDGAVAIITLNAPPMNLFSINTVNALEKLFPILRGDESVRCIVIRGGPTHFSGGANLREIMAGAAKGLFPDGFDYNGTLVPQAEAFIRQRMQLVNIVEAMPKPVVSSIQGACVGGGLELSLGCHFRLAAKGCKIGLPEIDRGFPPAWGGTVRLTKIVGRAKALDMALRGKLLDAPEALEIGLIHEMGENPQVIGVHGPALLHVYMCTQYSYRYTHIYYATLYRTCTTKQWRWRTSWH